MADRFSYIETQEELDATLVSATREITEVVVHWTANFIDQDIGSEKINDAHVNRGFNEIGYHFIILRDGSLQRGRDVNKQGAHALRRNKHSIGVAFVGGINLTTEEANRLGGYQAVASNSRHASSDSLTDAQFKTFDVFMDSFFKAFPYGQAFGHNDTDPNNKIDPGFDVVEYCNNKFDAHIFVTPHPDQSLSVAELLAEAIRQKGIA
tara:strand:+ start:1178 stop:1801 length:624 start_codon:yes stop_codon:yes gene_type:complete